jgi:adenylate cyclase
MQEIERKFLVAGNAWRRAVVDVAQITQGYLTTSPSPSVRIRTKDEEAWITVKFGTDPLDRAEFEYLIPLEDAKKMLNEFCVLPLIQKCRHYVPTDEGLVWEIDEFLNELQGLVLAEIELPSADAPAQTADWLGAEVTGNPAYLNTNLHKLELNDGNE